MVFRTASLLSAEVTPRDSLMIMSEPEARGPEEPDAEYTNTERALA